MNPLAGSRRLRRVAVGLTIVLLAALWTWFGPRGERAPVARDGAGSVETEPAATGSARGASRGEATSAAPGSAARPPAAPPRTAERPRAEEGGRAPGRTLPDTNRPGPVRGVVRDAAGRPIAGARVAWHDDRREPHRDPLDAWPGEPAAPPWAVTDANGRFQLSRPGVSADVDPRFRDLIDDPVCSALRVEATGHATASLRPGLADELSVTLDPPGALVVRWHHDATDVQAPAFEFDLAVELRPEPHDPARRAFAWPEEADPASPAGTLAWTLTGLGRGRWKVLLHGRERAEVSIEPGQTAYVDLRLPPIVEVVGALDGPPLDGLISLEEPVLFEEAHLAVRGGRVTGRARPGRYRGHLQEGPPDRLVDLQRSQRALPDAVTIPADGAPLQLRGPREPAPVSITLRWPGRRRPDSLLEELNLCSIDGAEELAVLRATAAASATYTGRAPPGRYALLDDRPSPIAEITVASGGASLLLDLVPYRVTVRFERPAGLEAGQLLTGWTWLEPVRPPGAARYWARALGIRAAFRVGDPEAPLVLDLLAPGRYVLHGETELGPFSFPLELGPETRDLTLSLPR